MYAFVARSLGLGLFRKHHNKEHSDDSVAELKAQSVSHDEVASHPDYISNYGPGGKYSS